MKFLAFIMAVVVLGLSLRPCKDSATPHSKSDIHATVAQDNDHRHNEDPDLCTPFCSCACCCSISLVRQIMENTAPALHGSVAHISLYKGTLSEIALPIWQPPQLAA